MLYLRHPNASSDFPPLTLAYFLSNGETEANRTLDHLIRSSWNRTHLTLRYAIVGPEAMHFAE